MGSDEKRLSRTIVRINAIESTSPLANNENLDDSTLPAALIPSEPEQPDAAYERNETTARVRAAIASLPVREQKVISLYYYAEATMKQIGAEIGVNESRVSQLHARAIRRLRESLGEMNPQQVIEMRKAFAAMAARKPKMAKADLGQVGRADQVGQAGQVGVVLPYKQPTNVAVKKPTPARAALKVRRARQAVAAAR